MTRCRTLLNYTRLSYKYIICYIFVLPRREKERFPSQINSHRTKMSSVDWTREYYATFLTITKFLRIIFRIIYSAIFYSEKEYLLYVSKDSVFINYSLKKKWKIIHRGPTGLLFAYLIALHYYSRVINKVLNTVESIAIVNLINI